MRVGCLFGSGQLRVKSVQVGYGFSSSEVQVRIYFGFILDCATVTQFGSGMGSVHFGLGEIQFNIRVNVRSGTNWAE